MANAVLRDIDQLRRDLRGYHDHLKAHDDMQRHCDNQRRRIAGLEGLYADAKAENAKLREYIGLRETCWKYVGWCGECPYNGVDEEHDGCNCTILEKVSSLARELGVEASND